MESEDLEILEGVGEYPWRNKEVLKELYIKREMTTREVGDLLGCNQKTICNQLEKRDLEARDSGKPEIEKLKDKEFVKQKYVVEGLSSVEIAEGEDFHRDTVIDWVRRHGFEVRTQEAPKQLKDEEWLRHQYSELQKNTYEIADEIDTGSTTVNFWLERHDIPRRPRSNPVEGLDDEEYLRNRYLKNDDSVYDIAEDHDTYSSTVLRNLKENEIEIKPQKEYPQLKDEDFLREEYIENTKSSIKIANEIGSSSGAVLAALRRNDIEVRSRGTYTGEDHPNWNGGGVVYYGNNWHEERRGCLRRDGYQCRDCGMTREESQDIYGLDLDVHHIRPISRYENPEDANFQENLMTLCKRCHKFWEDRMISWDTFRTQ